MEYSDVCAQQRRKTVEIQLRPTCECDSDSHRATIDDDISKTKHTSAPTRNEVKYGWLTPSSVLNWATLLCRIKDPAIDGLREISHYPLKDLNASAYIPKLPFLQIIEIRPQHCALVSNLGGVLKVYDSSGKFGNTQLQQILRLLPPERREIKPLIANVQQQDQNICGAYGICFLFALICGVEPEDLEIDETKVFGYIFDVFEECLTMEDFVKKFQCVRPTPPKARKSFITMYTPPKPKDMRTTVTTSDVLDRHRLKSSQDVQPEFDRYSPPMKEWPKEFTKHLSHHKGRSLGIITGPETNHGSRGQNQPSKHLDGTGPGTSSENKTFTDHDNTTTTKVKSPGNLRAHLKREMEHRIELRKPEWKRKMPCYHGIRNKYLAHYQLKLKPRRRHGEMARRVWMRDKKRHNRSCRQKRIGSKQFRSLV